MDLDYPSIVESAINTVVGKRFWQTPADAVAKAWCTSPPSDPDATTRWHAQEEVQEVVHKTEDGRQIG